MTPYQLIILMLKMLAEIREEYPADLLASRRAAFIAQIDARKRGESTAGNGALART